MTHSQSCLPAPVVGMLRLCAVGAGSMTVGGAAPTGPCRPSRPSSSSTTTPPSLYPRTAKYSRRSSIWVRPSQSHAFPFAWVHRLSIPLYVQAISRPSWLGRISGLAAWRWGTIWTTSSVCRGETSTHPVDRNLRRRWDPALSSVPPYSILLVKVTPVVSVAVKGHPCGLVL